MPERPSPQQLEPETVAKLSLGLKLQDGTNALAPDTEAWRELIAPALSSKEPSSALVRAVRETWEERWRPLCGSCSLPLPGSHLSGFQPLLAAWREDLLVWRLKQVGNWPSDLSQLLEKNRNWRDLALTMPRFPCDLVKGWTDHTWLTMIPAPGLATPWTLAVIQWENLEDSMAQPTVLTDPKKARHWVESCGSLRWQPNDPSSRDELLQMAHLQGAVFQGGAF